MEKKKLSGAENRKRKAAKELEKEKLRGQIHKFFKNQNIGDSSLSANNSRDPDPEDSCLAPFEATVDSSSSTSSHQQGDPQAHQSIASQSALPSSYQHQPTALAVSESDVTLFKSNDPATWPKIINDKVRKIIIEHGLTETEQKKIISTR